MRGETANTEEAATIAGLYLNRLRQNMLLQSDPTVLFAINTKEKRQRVRHGDLKFDSPYNTYRKYGLPPGPIGNPGRQALQAAVNPEPGDWIYFITVAPNDTRFTSSFEEFGLWKVEYKKNLR
ncbi:MAG: hypothetical protein RI989_1250, partial [Bacteroidota bacterium]